MLKLYSSPVCGRCRAVKTKLTSSKVQYEELNFNEIPEEEREKLLNEASSKGLANLPLLVKDGEIITLEKALEEDV